MSTELVADRMGAGDYALPIENVCIRWGIETTLQKSHFLGQIETESNGFRDVRESLNYSQKGLRSTFGSHRISDADCARFGRVDELNAQGNRIRTIRPANQEAIANILYGGEFGLKQLGNTKPGHGWMYRGRSLKHVTGLANYLACSLALYGDDRLVHSPELLEALPHAADAAGWFWKSKNLNALADTDNVETVTRRVNGGTNGLQRRIDSTARAKKEFARILIH